MYILKNQLKKKEEDLLMLISVDLGYGFTKAKSADKKIIFPSAAAKTNQKPFQLEGRATVRPGHYVELRAADSLVKNKLLVGELALREGKAVQTTLARERYQREEALGLTMTASYLLGVEGDITIALGVPLAFYHDQKDAIKQSFQGLSFNVSVDEGAEKRITFKEVYVFPQGIGALLSGSPIPKRGLIGVIDIGYHTTDYLLIEASDAGVQPLSSYMSSTQQGMHTAQTLFADAFRQETGRPITLNEARSMWDKDAIAFAGNKIDLITLKQEAKQETGRVIAENILAAWSDKIDFLDGLFLAGGAAIELLPVLKNYLTNPVLLDDSQFANANGFYQMANWSINKKQNLKAKTIN